MSSTSTISRSVGTSRLSALGKLIGNTPAHYFPTLSPRPGVRIIGKLEWLQLGGSVKARAAYRIIEQAIRSGRLKNGTRLLDASSGNTGIAYASICAALDIPLTLCIPENASKARIQILRGLGTELVLTSKLEGTDGAQAVAAQLSFDHPARYYYADQYNNPGNWQAHSDTTAREIFDQTNGRITHFVAGLGTTGTFIGTTRGLKNLLPQLTSVSLQPEFAMHGLEGWKHLETARVPGIYNQKVADDSLLVSTSDAYDMIRLIARKEGMLISPSSAANLLGAVKLAKSLDSGTVVTMLPDDASKYTEVLSQIM